MAPKLDVDAMLAHIKDAATRTGIEVYVVGGFVRDRLLGRPGKDIDLVAVGSDGVPLLADLAATLHWPKPQVFEHFGTGQIRGDGFVIEVVQARSERYDPQTRKPTVKPGTLHEDIMRRDFTVNALCQSLDGDVLDLTGQGLADLKARVLRTPLDPHETFSEDPLRMFRAARFVAQLDFDLAGGVLEAMQAQAQRSAILSAERIGDELRRLLTSAQPRRGLEVLRDSGLLQVVLPEIAAMTGIEQGGYHLYDVFDHTTRCVEAVAPHLTHRLGALFHDVGKPPTHAVREDGKHTFYNHPGVGARMTRAALARLRFSNEEIDNTAQLVLLHLRPIQYQDETFSDAAVRRLIRDAGELRQAMLDIARGDTLASSFPSLDSIHALEQRMEALDEGGRISRLRSPLSGEELMELAGNRGPGRWVGKAKGALLEAVLNGDIPPDDAAAARAWLSSHPEAFEA